jgi:hypothetical protein
MSLRTCACQSIEPIGDQRLQKRLVRPPMNDCRARPLEVSQEGCPRGIERKAKELRMEDGTQIGFTR